MINSEVLQIGVRYQVLYLGSGLTIGELKDAVLIETSGGPDRDEYEFETEMPLTRHVVAVRPALILTAEPA